jgi:hypothetical protein
MDRMNHCLLSAHLLPAWAAQAGANACLLLPHTVDTRRAAVWCLLQGSPPQERSRVQQHSPEQQALLQASPLRH